MADVVASYDNLVQQYRGRYTTFEELAPGGSYTITVEIPKRDRCDSGEPLLARISYITATAIEYTAATQPGHLTFHSVFAGATLDTVYVPNTGVNVPVFVDLSANVPTFVDTAQTYDLTTTFDTLTGDGSYNLGIGSIEIIIYKTQKELA